MTLGETIIRLRKEQGLSQEEVAAALEVSRQSVSKWENDSSVPELEKLVKLSELFGVTLDELVKGERPAPAGAEASGPAPAPPARQGFPPRKIAGTVLLCMAFLVVLLCTLLGGLLEGLVLCLPFLVCGVLCFVLRRHAGLGCAWAVWGMGNLYLRLATGIHWSQVRYTLIWEPSWNYTRLAMAWAELIWMLLMVAVTVWKLGRQPLEPIRQRKRFLAAGWVGWLALSVALRLGGRLLAPNWNFSSFGTLWSIGQVLSESLQLGLLTALLTFTLRLLRFSFAERKSVR